MLRLYRGHLLATWRAIRYDQTPMGRLRAEISYEHKQVPRGTGIFDTYEAILRTPDKGELRIVKGWMPSDYHANPGFDPFGELKEAVEENARDYAKRLGYDVPDYPIPDRRL